MFRNFIAALPLHTAPRTDSAETKEQEGKEKHDVPDLRHQYLWPIVKNILFAPSCTKRIVYHMRNQGNENGEHTNEDCHVTGWQFVTSRSQQHFVQVITPNWHAALGVKGCNGAPRRIRCEILLQGLDTFSGKGRVDDGIVLIQASAVTVESKCMDYGLAST